MRLPLRPSEQLQLTLPLRSPRGKPGWGGRRANAGRKRVGRPGVAHVTRPRHAGAHPVHVTLRGRRDVAAFRTQRVFDELQRAIARSQRVDFRIVHYSVQRDHVHLLVEASDVVRLRAGLQGMAIRMARAVNRALSRRRGSVWADRYHRHDLRTPREVRNALVYILMNHRKHDVTDVGTFATGHGVTDVGTMRTRHATGPLHDVALDPCSSARWLDGWSPRAGPLLDALHSCTPAKDLEPSCPVAPPRTWLARIGWRRHGALEPGERPAPLR